MIVTKCVISADYMRSSVTMGYTVFLLSNSSSFIERPDHFYHVYLVSADTSVFAYFLVGFGLSHNSAPHVQYKQKPYTC